MYLQSLFNWDTSDHGLHDNHGLQSEHLVNSCIFIHSSMLFGAITNHMILLQHDACPAELVNAILGFRVRLEMAGKIGSHTSDSLPYRISSTGRKVRNACMYT